MEKLNNQTAFNQVVRGLMKQGEPSFDAKGAHCFYRGTDGKKCAAGHLVPDELYKESMEKITIDNILDPTGSHYDKELAQYLSGVDIGLLTELQVIHDFSNPRVWLEQFRNVAKYFFLEMPEDVELDAIIAEANEVYEGGKEL